MTVLVLVIAVLALVTALAALAVHFNQRWKPQTKVATQASLELLSKKIDELEAVAKLPPFKRKLADGSTHVYYSGSNIFHGLVAYLNEFYSPNSVLAQDYVAQVDAQPIMIGIPDLVARMDALEAHTATAASPPVALPPDVVRRPALDEGLRAVERKISKAGDVSPELASYLKALHALTVGRERAPLDHKIEVLKTKISESRKGLKPLEEAVRTVRDQVAKAKRALLPEEPSDQELDREVWAHIKGLPTKPKTRSERRAIEANYETVVRPELVRAQKEALEEAERELAKTEEALNKVKASAEDSLEAEQKLAELRQELSQFEEAEEALIALEKATGTSSTLPSRRPMAVPPPARSRPVPSNATIQGLNRHPTAAPSAQDAAGHRSEPPIDGEDGNLLLPLPAPSPAKFCQKCGSPAAAGQSFCGSCGKSLTKGPPPFSAPSSS